MNTLIVVDYQNLFKTCEKKEIELDDLFKEIKRKGEEKGTIQEIRLFVPNYHHSPSSWKLINHLQLAYGVTVETCPVLRTGIENEKEYKDLTDWTVFAWINKHIHLDLGPELIIFITGDGHFNNSAIEVERKKKKVEFWILDPEATSQALLKYRSFEKLELEEKGEENPYALALKRRLEPEAKMEKEEKERIKILKKIQKCLSLLPSPEIEPKIARDFLSEIIAEVINLEKEEIRRAIEGLIDLRVIRTHSTYSLDSRSPYYQWLEYFEI